MSLPLLSARAIPTWHGSPGFGALPKQCHFHYSKPKKSGSQSSHVLSHRLRSCSIGRHAVRQSSNAAHPPQPDEKLRLIKSSDVLNEGRSGDLAEFWQSDGKSSASELLDEPTEDRHGSRNINNPRSTTWSTPSARLLSALQGAGLSSLHPRRLRSKLDLSFFDVRTLEALPSKGKWSGQTELSDVGNVKTISDGLAIYITHTVAPTLRSNDEEPVQDILDDDNALNQVFTPEYIKLLHARGFEVDDVVIWAWIVTSKSADQAAKRLLAISTKLSSTGRPPVPLFVILLILRAPNLHASSLKLIMNVLWTTIPGLGIQGQPSVRQSQISEQSAVILLVRLIRHARKVWPEALGEIVSLMMHIIGADGSSAVPMKTERAQRLCHIYNRVLTLISLPTSANPFRAVAIQQRAQFGVLRQMNQFEPKLPLTREGFRALAKVQIAHKKTEKERQWARFKALSWPPWKENKSGIDAESGYAGSLSRAVGVLARMGESGYNSMSWERQARVLAGWDTDRSPTIQRRKLLGRPSLVRSTTSLDGLLSVDSERDHEIWAARISATRTAKEAWACFCSYEKQHAGEGLDASRQTPGRLAPWHAMFERVFYAAREVPGDHIDPGDGKETYPEPISPHDFLYVPSEPPSVDELFNKMTGQGLKPAGRLLADLLDHAPTASQGLGYISSSLLTEIKKDVLMHAEKYHLAYIHETISSIPDFLFAAFVRLLTRARSHDLEFYLPASASSLSVHRAGSARKIRITPDVYASQIVAISGSSYLPAWHALFVGLLRQLRNPKTKKVAKHEHVYRIWTSMQELLRGMNDAGITVDVPCLHVIYQISEEAMICSPYLGPTPGKDSVEYITRLATANVKRLFQGIVTGYQDPPAASWLQSNSEASLLAVPSPANLPGLVRVLGIGGDIDGILCLLRWMSCFATELEAVSKEVSNGQRMLRRTVITIRVFLERSWMEPGSASAAVTSQSATKEAKQLIQQHPHWGGWPTDNEVQDYIKKTKGAYFHRVRELEKFRTSVKIAETEENVPDSLPHQAC